MLNVGMKVICAVHHEGLPRVDERCCNRRMTIRIALSYSTSDDFAVWIDSGAHTISALPEGALTLARHLIRVIDVFDGLEVWPLTFVELADKTDCAHLFLQQLLHLNVNTELAHALHCRPIYMHSCGNWPVLFREWMRKSADGLTRINRLSDWRALTSAIQRLLDYVVLLCHLQLTQRLLDSLKFHIAYTIFLSVWNTGDVGVRFSLLLNHLLCSLRAYLCTVGAGERCTQSSVILLRRDGLIAEDMVVETFVKLGTMSDGRWRPLEVSDLGVILCIPCSTLVTYPVITLDSLSFPINRRICWDKCELRRSTVL